MKLISKISMVIAVLLYTFSSYAQIKNAKTETVEIYGNCGMCKATIEKAGTLNNISTVTWNKNTKIATLNFDSKKTNRDEILKRIALAGYDSENFLAPDDVYAKLPECCQYERLLKPVSTSHNDATQNSSEHSNHSHNETAESTNVEANSVSQLKVVFDNYFLVKDALVKSDVSTSSAKLIEAIKAVDMAKLSSEEHDVWMDVFKDLEANAQKIAQVKDLEKQRENFALLSKDMYKLAKVSKQGDLLYYQHCPMYNDGKGANWLSREKAIKNPYYGSKMLTCGSVQETITNK